MDESLPLSSEPAATESTACPSCAEYLAGWKRAQADYQNVQRERERERQDLAKYANERLLRDLLPAFDQYQLAMSYLPSTDTLPSEAKAGWDAWLTGIKAVQSLWKQAAEQTGLEPVATTGLFDPRYHEAIGEEASDEPAGTILRTLTPGWMLHGRVLQAARVMIAKPHSS